MSTDASSTTVARKPLSSSQRWAAGGVSLHTPPDWSHTTVPAVLRRATSSLPNCQPIAAAAAAASASLLADRLSAPTSRAARRS